MAGLSGPLLACCVSSLAYAGLLLYASRLKPHTRTKTSNALVRNWAVPWQLFNSVVMCWAGVCVLSCGWLLSEDRTRPWCNINPSSLSRIPDTPVLGLYQGLRTVQLLETALLVLQGQKPTLLHVGHHITMLWSSCIWTLSCLRFGCLLALVNSVDNFLLYSRRALTSDTSTAARCLKQLLHSWTEAETLLGYFTGIMLLGTHFIHGHTGCLDLVPFAATVGIHASVGLFLNHHRASALKHEGKAPVQTPAGARRSRQSTRFWGSNAPAVWICGLLALTCYSLVSPRQALTDMVAVMALVSVCHAGLITCRRWKQT